MPLFFVIAIASLTAILIGDAGRLLVFALRHSGSEDGSRILVDASFIAVLIVALIGLISVLRPWARATLDPTVVRVGVSVVLAIAMYQVFAEVRENSFNTKEDLLTTIYIWLLGFILIALPTLTSNSHAEIRFMGLATLAALVSFASAGIWQLLVFFIHDFGSVSPFLLAPMGLAPAACVWGISATRLWNHKRAPFFIVSLFSLPFIYGALVNFEDNFGLGGAFTDRSVAGIVITAVAIFPAIGAALASRGLSVFACLVVLPTYGAVLAVVLHIVSPNFPELSSIAGQVAFARGHLIGSFLSAVVAVASVEDVAGKLGYIETLWRKVSTSKANEADASTFQNNDPV